MATLTPNFSWYLPTVAGDGNVWGTYLDSNWTSNDTLLRAIANCNIATTSPAIGQTGSLWMNNTSNPYPLNIYDGAQWVSIGTLDISTHTFTSAGVTTPFSVGDYKFSALTSNHGFWLKCDGTAISRSTYATLFGIISTSFGVGNGTTTFNLPDLRGRVPGAVGTGSGLSARTLGQAVGEERHTLITAEIPAHTHTYRDFAQFSQFTAAGGTGQDGVSSAPTGSTGGGGSHNNMQPTLFIGSMFIYSGV